MIYHVALDYVSGKPLYALPENHSLWGRGDHPDKELFGANFFTVIFADTPEAAIIHATIEWEDEVDPIEWEEEVDPTDVLAGIEPEGLDTWNGSMEPRDYPMLDVVMGDG